MKKVFVLFLATSFAVACNSSGDGKTAEEKTDSSKTATSAISSADEAALEMIASLDCTTCHKINEKNIGPAYIDVSKKYEATEENIDSLAHKVIKGGFGVWGQVPMTAHPDLSLDSARTMVKYILSLKNQ
jgi:cytochrome c